MYFKVFSQFFNNHTVIMLKKLNSFTDRSCHKVFNSILMSTNVFFAIQDETRCRVFQIYMYSYFCEFSIETSRIGPPRPKIQDRQIVRHLRFRDSDNLRITNSLRFIPFSCACPFRLSYFLMC